MITVRILDDGIVKGALRLHIYEGTKSIVSLQLISPKVYFEEVYSVLKGSPAPEKYVRLIIQDLGFNNSLTVSLTKEKINEFNRRWVKREFQEFAEDSGIFKYISTDECKDLIDECAVREVMTQ